MAQVLGLGVMLLRVSRLAAARLLRPSATGRIAFSARLSTSEARKRPRVAAIISIVESCRRLNIPIRDYVIHQAERPFLFVYIHG